MLESVFDVIYTDFSKAIDSVAHWLNYIISELKEWIRSFLSGQIQHVNVKGIFSDWKDVISGVPQGSVIGTVLFIRFINDMSAEVKKELL